MMHAPIMMLTHSHLGKPLGTKTQNGDQGRKKYDFFSKFFGHVLPPS
jgi:hypothetical protein